MAGPQSSVPLVERLGLLLVGLIVIACAIGMIAMVLHKLAGTELGISELFVLCFAVVFCCVIVAYGVFLLKRATRTFR